MLQKVDEYDDVTALHCSERIIIAFSTRHNTTLNCTCLLNVDKLVAVWSTDGQTQWANVNANPNRGQQTVSEWA